MKPTVVQFKTVVLVVKNARNKLVLGVELKNKAVTGGKMVNMNQTNRHASQ